MTDVFIATEDDGSQWVTLEDYQLLSREYNAFVTKHHFGDPCVFCGTPHDKVVSGDCPQENK